MSQTDSPSVEGLDQRPSLEDQLAQAERSLVCAEHIDNFARLEREPAYWRGRVAEIKRQMADESAYLRSAVDALGDAMRPEHQPSYYLSDEAAELRLHALVQRVAVAGLRPGESVPARIMGMVERVHDGRLDFIRRSA